jgi:hypothetical protein
MKAVTRLHLSTSGLLICLTEPALTEEYTIFTHKIRWTWYSGLLPYPLDHHYSPTRSSLVLLLVLYCRRSDVEKWVSDPQPRILINSHFRWSSSSDRPPSLIQNTLLVDHTPIHRIITCDRATDWRFTIVIISWANAPIFRLGLTWGRVHRKHDATNCGEELPKSCRGQANTGLQ